MVAIMLETMVAAEDMLCVMMTDNATGDALRLGRPVWHAPGELTRDSGNMPLGSSML